MSQQTKRKEFPKDAIALKFNGAPVDLNRGLPDDAEPEVIFLDSEEGLEILRHSTRDLMAQRCRSSNTGAQLTIGPPIENGFYYDIDVDVTFTPEDLKTIEARMKNSPKRNTPSSARTSPARTLWPFSGKGARTTR